MNNIMKGGENMLNQIQTMKNEKTQDMKKSPIVHATRDYDKFKKINGNRDVMINHVNQLVKITAMQNLLYAFPGVVTKDDYLIDGQHRLEDAKINNLWFYYIKIDEKIDDIIVAIVNDAHLSWRPSDYVHFFAQRGNEQYIFLEELKKDTKISIANMIAIFGYTGKPIKYGNMVLFKDADEKKALYELLEAYIDLKDIFVKNVFFDREFAKALRIMFQQVSSADIKKEVNRANIQITVQSTQKDYLRIFEVIFNRFRRGNNQVRFF